jgi:hypothetical protein
LIAGRVTGEVGALYALSAVLSAITERHFTDVGAAHWRI